jgi:integrase
MPNFKVNVMVRLSLNGKQTFLKAQWFPGNTARLKEPPAKGVFYLSWLQNGQKKYRRVGSDPRLALVEMERQEGILASDNPTRIVAPWSRPTPSVTLADAIDAFLLERKASQNPTSVRRMTKELSNFAETTGRKYLSEVTRADIFTYWSWLKDVRGSAPRTIYNRIQTVLTFLKNRGVTRLLSTDEMPQFDEKDVDYYTENNPDELQRFFAHCDPEQRLAFMFFLYSGCREREVMFACWDDIDFVHKTYTVAGHYDDVCCSFKGTLAILARTNFQKHGVPAIVERLDCRRPVHG